jgi:hypothetical protein
MIAFSRALTAPSTVATRLATSRMSLRSPGSASRCQLGLQVRARVIWKSASGVPRHEEFNDLVI